MGKKGKTWKEIETSRNRRLWITSVLIPAATTIVAAEQIPEVKEFTKKTINKAKKKKDQAVAYIKSKTKKDSV